MMLPWWFATFCRWRDRHATPRPPGGHVCDRPDAAALAATDRLTCLGIFLKSYSNEELDELTERSERIKASGLDGGAR